MMNAAPVPVAEFEYARRKAPIFVRTSTPALMAKVFPPIG